MKISHEFSLALKEECIQLLHRRLTVYQEEWTQLSNDAAQEGKSSAGDKHETARAMAQLEQEKLAGQIAEIKDQLLYISGLDTKEAQQKIQPGSLVETDQGLFYLTVPIGRISFRGCEVMVCSPVSPIGKLFLRSQVTDKITFGTRQYTVLGIH